MSGTFSAADFGLVYFAWAADGDVFNAVTDARQDLAVLALTISEEEGQFATARITIANPRAGLLTSESQRRCFISAVVSGTVQLLFAGRVQGLPAGMEGETLDLEFTAAPLNWKILQAQYLSGLLVAPCWDGALSKPEDAVKPEEVLAGRPALLHWSRLDASITLSNIIADGTQSLVAFGTNPFYDSVQISLGDAPVQTVSTIVTCAYEQQARVVVDLSSPLLSAWSTPGLGCGTLTPQAFEGAWPKVGDELGGNTGWTVSTSHLLFVTGGPGTPYVTIVQNQFPIDPAYIYDSPVITSTDEPWTADYNDPTMTVPVTYQCPVTWYELILHVRGDYSQKRSETVWLTLSSDIQPVLDFAEPPVESLSITDPLKAFASETCTVSSVAPLTTDLPGTLATTVCTTVRASSTTVVTTTPSDTVTVLTASDGGTKTIASTPTGTTTTINSSLGTWVVNPDGSQTVTTPGWSEAINTAGVGVITGVYNTLLHPRPYFNFVEEPILSWTVNNASTTVTEVTPQQSAQKVTTTLATSGPIMPIANPSYFASTAGAATLAAIMARMAARLTKASRCVTVEFDAPLELAWNLTCRNAASITDDRLPGGQATGKVTSVSLTIDDKGTRASVRLGCSIGRGGANPSAATGTQVLSGGCLVDGMANSVPFKPVDPTQFGNFGYCVKSVRGAADAAYQMTMIEAAGYNAQQAASWLQNNPTLLYIVMLSLREYTPDLWLGFYPFQVGQLELPRNIDLGG